MAAPRGGAMSDPMTPRSCVSSVVWPAIVGRNEAALLAMAFQLERSQWWSPHDLAAHQRGQLAGLLRHAARTVPWYRDRLAAAGLGGDAPITEDRWARLPLLTRQDIRDHRAELASEEAPPDHGQTYARKTSGSTGEPLEVVGTEVTGFVWESLVFRDDLWHGRDLRGRLVVIRSGRDAPDPLLVHDFPGWGYVSPALYETGPMTLFYHTMPLERQVEILEARSPHYLLTYPSNARALCRLARRRPVRLPDLRAVLTYGEPLGPDVRAACEETWGAPVQDVYSCEELGILALQCPRHPHYHVQSEAILLEIVDDEGRACAPGQIGRVVLTSLHNFAMPLLRYAIGDYAEAGGPCPCGRGLPVVARILGRRRNQVSLPDGRRAWPDAGAIWEAIPGVDQIQVVQEGPESVRARYTRASPLSPREEPASRASLRRALGHPFRVTFSRQASIARGANGKYETFFDSR
jgi:phenylacetate-CoA ligase